MVSKWQAYLYNSPSTPRTKHGSSTRISEASCIQSQVCSKTTCQFEDFLRHNFDGIYSPSFISSSIFLVTISIICLITIKQYSVRCTKRTCLGQCICLYIGRDDLTAA